MSYDEFDAARDQMYEDTIKGLSEESVRYHLGTVGDAIEERVRRCLKQAEDLRYQGFYGPALISAVTAIELIIRFLLVRPLTSGAFLSDEWESILADRIGSGQTARDRELLPAVLKVWGFDIGSIMLPNGAPLWQSLTDRREGALAKRDRVVHQAATVQESDALTAVECANTMTAIVVHKIAEKFGFTLETTGLWSHSRLEREKGLYSERRVSPWDPIDGTKFEVRKMKADDAG